MVTAVFDTGVQGCVENSIQFNSIVGNQAWKPNCARHYIDISVEGQNSIGQLLRHYHSYELVAFKTVLKLH